MTELPAPGDEFTDDHGETHTVAEVEEWDDGTVVIHAAPRADGLAVITDRARFEDAT